MRRRKVVRWGGGVFGITALVGMCHISAGCARVQPYEPRPLEPTKSETAFRARTLDDPGLREFLRKHDPAAADPWPVESWDLESLTAAALYFHQDIKVATAQIGVAEAGETTAAMRPNPTLSLSIAPPWAYGFNLDIPIETAGKRDRRVERAEHLTEAARLQLGETVWRVRSRLRAALVNYALATAETNLLREEQEMRRARLELLQQRFKVGEVSRPDVDTVSVELITAQVAGQAAESRFKEAEAALAAAIGVPVSAVHGIQMDWEEVSEPPSVAEITKGPLQAAGLLNRLDVRRMLSEYAAAESALQLEIARQHPDVNLGVGYTWDAGMNKFTLGFATELPIFNRNEGPIAEAAAKREELAARFVALQNIVIGDTERALARYEGHRKELDEADVTLTQVLGKREESARRAVQVGHSDRLELSGIEVERVVLMRAALDALRKAQEALGALEDAVQRPLGSEGPVPQIHTADNSRQLPAKTGGG